VKIASFASIAPRRAQLIRAVESIIAQVDHVFIYLNGHPEPWPGLWSYADKITWAFSRTSGWRGSEGKFWWSDAAKFARPIHLGGDVAFGCDDDIEYPCDYVEGMIESLERHPGSIVGVHGARIKEPITGYHECLDLRWRFTAGLLHDTRVHILGTGTIAYRPKDIRLDFAKFYVPNMSDLWLAILAREQSIDLWAVHRPARWCRAIPTTGYSISSAKSSGRDLAETELVQMHAPWPKL